MVGHGRMPGVGAVGARLLFPDGRVQHAGMAIGLEGGLPGHLFKLAPWWHRGDLDWAVVARECSAVTAACLLTRRSVFLEMGGFDESRFAVAFNDVDYCLRLGRSGLRSIYAPRAELLHHEGATRGFGDDPAETGAYLAAWGHLIDPYMNPCWRGAPDRGGQESAQG
jgi:GT2 family glycosyltransferase